MNGYFALTFTAVLSIAVIAVVACALALWYVNTPSFQRDWERMCRNIAGAFTGAISWASAQAKALAQSIGDSFARARSKPKYRTPREDHHIVAQMAYNASLARSVLRTVGIGINSRENRVLIKTGLHRRLHTNTYYGFANAVVISAYNKGSGNYQKRFNVLNALKTLKGMILAMDAIAPY